MIDYIVFSKDSGRILQKVSNQPFEHLLEREDIGVLLLLDTWGGSGSTHYVLDGEIVERPILPTTPSSQSIVANGQEVLSVEGIPSSAIYVLDGPVQDRWEDDNELTVDVPGRYTLYIDCWPYQTVTVEFDGT